MEVDKKIFYPIAKPCLTLKEREYLLKAFDSGWISSIGEFIEKFEKEFAKYIGVKYALVTSSGTTALHLALVACGIKEGDEVIIPDLTFIATANAVRYTGAKVLPVDLERETLCISPEAIKRAITSKTKAIIPVHLYGHPVRMDEIMKIAKEYGLSVIEDAAEAHGAEFKGQKVGSFGNCAIFSFYGNKIITTGEGGMVVTNDPDLYEKIKFLRDHAMDPARRYWHTAVGFNYRITNLQAAIGVAQLEKIEEFIAKRRKIFEWYKKYLGKIGGIRLLEEREETKSVYWMICLEVESFTEEKREKFMQALKMEGVDTRPYFYPISMMPMYYDNEARQKNTNAYRVYKKGLNLPTYYELTEDDVKWICEKVKKLLRNYL